MPEEANLMPISRVYIRTISFVYAGRKTSLGKMPFISRKAKKKGDFWEEACLCLFISPQWVTQACEQTGDLQHRYSSNLSSSTFHKPGLTSGLEAIWNEVSNLCCPLQQHGTHQRPWGTPGGSHWHVSWGQTEVYPLPIACNSCCKLNLLGLPPKTQSFLGISWCMFKKSSKALHTWFMFLLFAWVFLICWGEEKTPDVRSWA